MATKIRPHVEGHIAQNYKFRQYGLFKHEWKNHAPASLIRKNLGARIFDNYFKFCVEREPVDKCISHYSMYKNSPEHQKSKISDMSWEEYVEIGKFPVNTKKFADDVGNLLVDRILRYENLQAELAAVADQLGFEVSLTARAKTGFRIKVDVTEHQKKRIYDAFASSNIHTGYTGD